MANNFLTPSVIATEGLRILKNESAFLGKINTQYGDMFGRKSAMVGQSIQIRVPTQFTKREGPTANLQDINQRNISLTIQPEFGVDVQISDYDLSLNLNDFSDTVLRPAMVTLATALDMKVLSMYKQVANEVYSTTFGTLPTTQIDTQTLVLKAKQKLNANSAPMSLNERMMAIGTNSEVAFVAPLNLGFNSQSLIGDQYKTGNMGTALGFQWMESQNMPVHTVGPLGGTPLVNGANQGIVNSGTTDNPQAGTTTLVTDGWTAAAGLRLYAGDVFTINGVFEVNPVNKQTTGQLRQFVATTDTSSDGAGNATVIISPAIIAGGAYQNVTARPADNAPINVLGLAGKQYEMNMAFVKDAFTLATVDMDLPNGMDMAVQKNLDGVSMRFVRGFDILNNRRISRFDILAGWACLRPEWAVRVPGNQLN